MENAWTVERAQSALGEGAYQLLAAEDALKLVSEALSASEDEDERQEHQKPFDVATEVLATVECVVDDFLRPAIRALQRAAQITDAELEREFLDRRRKGCRRRFETARFRRLEKAR
ncbi:MAG TPA: hypothetical protein VGS22_21770 [Thermoanaerobaculia bacterium]|jgi:hypothetical protein|nr:hypothetical protein [Thermoanaerobaculia bacterium]